MKLTIRMDDITPGMDWEKFERFIALLEQYQIKPLLGIVPDNQDPGLNVEPEREDFYGRMRQLQEQGYVMALHGWHHVYVTKKRGMFPLNPFSEFAGVPKEQQAERIQEGKKLLEAQGICPKLFMAPGHSFDRHTLAALKQCGMDKLTDGFGKHPYVYGGMTFYPIAFKRDSSLKKKAGCTTLVFHTNTMKEQDFAAFEKLLKIHGEKFADYAEYMSERPQKRGAAGHLLEYAMALTKAVLVQIKGRIS